MYTKPIPCFRVFTLIVMFANLKQNKVERDFSLLAVAAKPSETSVVHGKWSPIPVLMQPIAA